MAFCKNCRTNLPDGAAFCSSCGTPASDGAQTQQTQQVQPVNYTSYQAADPETADVQNNKVMAVLAYIGILVLIPLFAAKESKYARFHTKQGLTLAIFSAAYGILTGIINAVLSFILPARDYYFYSVPNPIVSIVSTILGLGSIFFVVLAIMGIVSACQGKKQELPVLGKINFFGTYFD